MSELPETLPDLAFDDDPSPQLTPKDYAVDIHKPKPVHNWREFLGEIAVVVLGIVIALTGEQLVEAWHWHDTVETVRTSLTGELANDRGRWEVNMAIAPCTIRAIARLDHWAEGAPANATVPITLIPRTDARLWSMNSANWNLAIGSQSLNHFPLKEQLALASLYDGIAHRQTGLDQVSDFAGQLATLLPLAADPVDRHQMRITLGNMKNELSSLIDDDRYMKRHFDALGIRANRDDIAADLNKPDCS